MKAMRLIVVGLCAALVAPLGLAAKPECLVGSPSVEAATPTDRFEILNEQPNVATDKVTGLMWMRCPWGMTLNTVYGCIPAVVTPRLGWKDAIDKADDPAGDGSHSLFGKSGWRVPNVKELASIIEHGCESPSINKLVFPSTPVGKFWTSSPISKTGALSNVWAIDFQTGVADAGVEATYQSAGSVRTPVNTLYVRFVRDAN